MPSVLDNAKEAAYTAVGLNVLFLDQVSERFAGPREQLEEQADIARNHATKARAEWQQQADEMNAAIKNRLPFDVDTLTGRVKDALPFEVDAVPAQLDKALRSNVRRTWELTEPTLTWVAGRTPAPLDDYVTDGVAKLRDLVTEVTEAAASSTTGPAPAAKKAPARKTAARKTTAAKTTARKTTAKKAPARKAAAPKAAAPEATTA